MSDHHNGRLAGAIAAIVVSGWISTGAASAASGTPLVPHQAAYELSLKASRGNVSLTTARGRILYNFGGSACEGYTSDFRQVSELDGEEGKTIFNDLRSTSWEDGEGKSYRFKINTRMNSDAPNEVDGMAERSDKGVTVKLTKPQAKTVTLDGDIVFPTEQIRRVIAAAREKKSLLELNVYDGSDTGEKVYSTLTVIGQPINGDKAASSSDPSLTDPAMTSLTRWPVTVSYYDRDAKTNDGEQTPVYSMSFELFENGVSRSLVLDYNDFAVAGAMSKLEIKPAKACK